MHYIHPDIQLHLSFINVTLVRKIQCLRTAFHSRLFNVNRLLPLYVHVARFSITIRSTGIMCSVHCIYTAPVVSKDADTTPAIAVSAQPLFVQLNAVTIYKYRQFENLY